MNPIHEMIKWEKKDKKKKQQARYNPSVQGHTPPGWINMVITENSYNKANNSLKKIYQTN